MQTKTLQQLAKRQWRWAGTWALAALALFAGLPKAGCICADGGFKQFCPILAEHSSPAAPASCCQPQACEPSTAATTKSCCSEKHPTGDFPAAAPEHDGCCQPTVLTATLTVKAQEADSLSTPAIQPLLLPLPMLAAASSERAGEIWEGHSGPLVVDRVIVLLRLTI